MVTPNVVVVNTTTIRKRCLLFEGDEITTRYNGWLEGWEAFYVDPSKDDLIDDEETIFQKIKMKGKIRQQPRPFLPRGSSSSSSSSSEWDGEGEGVIVVPVTKVVVNEDVVVNKNVLVNKDIVDDNSILDGADF